MHYGGPKSPLLLLKKKTLFIYCSSRSCCFSYSGRPISLRVSVAMMRSFRFSGAVHLGSDCRDSMVSFFHMYSILASQCQGLKVNSTQLVLISNEPGDKNCSLLSLRSMNSKLLSPWNAAGGTLSNLFFCRKMWVRLGERLKAFTSRDWILFWSKWSLSKAGWASKHPTGSSSSLFCERCRTLSWLRLWSWGHWEFH